MNPNRFQTNTSAGGYNFGTFGGVYTPALLTILGLVMFMRTNFVLGHVGTEMMMLILAVGASITLSTGLSIATISTNTRVMGGGAYFLISRVLGPSFGTSIGLVLFFAQCLSVPFNIIGATESLALAFPVLKPFYLYLCLGLGLFVFFVVWRGAEWAIKTQYVIMVILGLSIVSFLLGPIVNGLFSAETFAANWAVEPATAPDGLSIFACFALFFPAVTGIMAGVNMSGDLKDPHKSIPRGTLAALMTAVVIYLLQILVAAACFPREELIANPYLILEHNSLFGFPWIILAGVQAATLSTAIGWLLGAPRVLQSLAMDGVIPILKPFATGAKKTNEPRRALAVAIILTTAILVWGGLAGEAASNAGSSPINTLAVLVALFFLFTYAIINMAAFVESSGSNPSFRPSFKCFHWSIALYGSVACLVVTFLIDFKLALIGCAVLTCLYLWIRYRRVQMVFGDARRGFVYAQVYRLLLSLPKFPLHPKNWRPTSVVFCKDPILYSYLIEYAVLFSHQRGILSVIQVSEPKNNISMREQRLFELNKFRQIVRERKWPIFPEVIVSSEFDESIRVLLQGHSLDPIKPNIAILGWPKQEERLAPFFDHVRTIVSQLELNCLLVANGRSFPAVLNDSATLDLWFESPDCGSLMLILGYLIRQNRAWRKSEIRVFFTAENPLAVQMSEALQEARIQAQVVMLPPGVDWKRDIMTYSRSAQLVMVEFLRYSQVDVATQQELHRMVSGLNSSMPPMLLVVANGEADLFS